MKKAKHNVLVISDTQIPFQHQDYIAFLKTVERKYDCDQIVHIGDEVDFHALGDWDHDPDGYSAGDELALAQKELKRLYKAFPNVMACTSNHTARPFRKAFKHGIPKAFLRDYAEFLQAPRGWSWQDSWEIDGVRYEHGEGFSGRDGAIKSAQGNMQSTVIGHIHAFAGIAWNANPKHLFFGFNVGCLIDDEAYAFRYNKKQKNRPIVGCGVVQKGIPLFVPMQLKKGGRWTGKI
jgi:hypothetical protein